MPFFDTIRAGASGVDSSFTVNRSLKFNRPDNAQLTRTLSSAGNRQKWTWSGWVKVTGQTGENFIFGAAPTGANSNSNYTIINFNNNQIQLSQYTGHLRTANAKSRDIGAWQHFVVVFDSANSTADDRAIIYHNGNRITDLGNNATISQNYETAINNNIEHQIGGSGQFASQANDNYLAEINFIEGQALTPSSFAETDSTTGQWIPIDTSGLTFGTNGFRLQFEDNSGTTATTLGKDTSGNSNNWTPNNFSVSAGSGNDSVEDTPTNNFATFNPQLTDQRSDAVYSEGNTKVVTGSGAGTIGISFAALSGKWYAEFKCTAKTSVNMGVGIQTVTGYDGERQWNESQNGGFGIAYVGGDNEHSGKRATDGGGLTSYGASYVVDDIIGVALDIDNKTVNFSKNNSFNGTIDITTTKGDFYVMTVGHGQGGCTNTWEGNFGQRAFSYTPPTGFVAMNSQNLPDPTINIGENHVNTTLYTGNGGTQSITGLEFQPDWVWLKKRNGTTNHLVFDSVRGTNKSMNTNGTGTEDTSSTNKLTSFNSDGFTIGSNSSGNNNGDSYVSWNWYAGGSTVTNNDGSISSQVMANTTAGFSIVSYTGTGSAGTVGHGLGVAPSALIVKSRNTTNNWRVGHNGLIDWQYRINLESTSSQSLQSNVWNSTPPTSSVFSVGTSSSVNDNGNSYIAYVFSEVAGFSKYGKFFGNGQDAGPFIYLGFKPQLLITRNVSSTTDWIMFDPKRIHDASAGNLDYLEPNTSDAEGFLAVDILSNGFRLTHEDNTKFNGSGNTFIYFAWAESPFKYARAN